MVKHLNVIAAATLLSLVGAAHAAGEQSAANLRLPPVSAIGMDPATGNTSDPSNWRFAPGQNIGGVAGPVGRRGSFELHHIGRQLRLLGLAAGGWPIRADRSALR